MEDFEEMESINKDDSISMSASDSVSSGDDMSEVSIKNDFLDLIDQIQKEGI